MDPLTPADAVTTLSGCFIYSIGSNKYIANISIYYCGSAVIEMNVNANGWLSPGLLAQHGYQLLMPLLDQIFQVII